ncbi:TPA: hypothetical protein DDW69_02030 [candidate division CPR2 bacterium]|uniref:SHOCT domain-containing protein n=1 Tax=candidate division CPR2 bacterium GW2011_GWC1_41_48 TaxID=1618344 RepID=A0A0G0WCM0_UNCC2|nr:MAG: Membrane protein-like protein [candidate division CPR2 bacterium GW2011_GWC2_39_35]KKR28140.1 MAG: Membrane protein-like protein [candidate division CPR2 bacterium GW2011_GWD2_39_7]KKS09802.1 MAG: hypothetical protein UU65_C0001G0207 [candidate division CPR2 bacterium GW2011_GWC1_41_48]OGB72257.1 MAG: hypothetical protein A2Y26_05305 [candidate division CPR2 bacterium GWD2_39_7]HBG81598.1 hypothetical protein [candidate division CPR2 bacterium]
MCPFCPHNFGLGFGQTAFWVGTVLSILFWSAFIYFIYWLIKRAGWLERPEARGRENALRILDERFAKGEIDKKEYEERKRDLQK